MPKFGQTSKERLSTCSEPLQIIFNKVITIIDCSIVEGHRPKAEQNRYFDMGKSRVQWPNGKHNGSPSRAVDAAPFINGRISWNEKHCLYFAGIVIATAYFLKIPIRWGGDWDRDNEPITDQDFQDLVHFELTE